VKVSICQNTLIKNCALETNEVNEPKLTTEICLKFKKSEDVDSFLVTIS